ncbi:hypothetical protein EMIHUDRAFT_435551, partial [Emiliania huxleyi CCMP1516]|uniref:ANK_REP_REGION domain-containing protein n=2 Tax=Emiliania huxleyi TaxID=2903 RepID=A0A0D3JKP1_EMIH1
MSDGRAWFQEASAVDLASLIDALDGAPQVAERALSLAVCLSKLTYGRAPKMHLCDAARAAKKADEAEQAVLLERLESLCGSGLSAEDLAAAAKVESCQTNGGSVLHAVASRCGPDSRCATAKAKHVCGLLLAAGANASAANASGETPAAVAASGLSFELKRYLLTHEPRRKFVAQTPAHVLAAASEALDTGDSSQKGRAFTAWRRHDLRVRIEARSASLARELTEAECVTVYTIDEDFVASHRSPIGELLDTFSAIAFARSSASGRPFGRGRLDFRLAGERLDGTEQISTLGLSHAHEPLANSSVI